MANTDRELILRKIFIGGVKPDTQDDQFRDHFSQFGEIEELVHVRNRETKISKGFAFITFKDSDAVDKTIAEKPHNINGKDVDVKRAVPKDQSQDKCTKIFVGGLPETDEGEIKRFFETYGPVSQTQFKRDQATGRGRGFGFVTFENHDTVDKLIIMKHIEFKGKKIECKKASNADNNNNSNNKNNNNQHHNNNPSVYNQHPQQGGYPPHGGYGPPAYPPPHGHYPPPGYPPHYPGYGAPAASAPAAAGSTGGGAAAAPPPGYPGYPPSYPGYPPTAAAPSYPGYPGYPPPASSYPPPPASHYPQQAGQYGGQSASTYGAAQKASYSSSHSSRSSANYKPY